MAINCRNCGAEISSGTTCAKCEKDAKQGLDVQYKDFRGSEMLDIKMSSQAESNDDGDLKQSPLNAEADSLKTASGKRLGRRPVIIIAVTAGSIVSALAWYYILKYLFQH